MNIGKIIKKSLRSPGFWISLAGLIALGTAFALWFGESRGSGWGKAAAFCSAALCLRFVPGWIDFWRGKPLPCPGGDREPRGINGKIFAAILLYLLSIIFSVYLIRGFAGYGWDFVRSLEFWTCTDSRHYLDIARDWYLSEGEWDRLVQLVFLPGYPIAVRLASKLIGDYLISGLMVSALSFAGAGVIFYRLMRLDWGHEKALRALKYLCIVPGAFFFAAPMSESLFLLLSVSCIYLSRRGKWGLSCLLGALATFTRSLGMALFVPVLFEMVRTAAAEKGGKRFWRFALLFLIPAGFGAYCCINFRVSGDWLKYMEYQSVHWGQRLGLFFNTAAYQTDNAIGSALGDKRLFWGLWLPNLLASFSSLLLLTAAAKKLRPSMTAYFIAYFFVAIGATWLLSAPRYLAALLPIPMAMAEISRSKILDRAATALWIFAGFAYMLAFVFRWQVW